jgi:carnosine N-methyltransferase
MQTFEDTFNASKATTSYDSVEHIIVHMARDWSKQGAEIRERLYLRGAVQSLLAHLSWDVDDDSGYGDTRAPKVLVPGAGVGRLALEIASRGFE